MQIPIKFFLQIFILQENGCKYLRWLHDQEWNYTIKNFVSNLNFKWKIVSEMGPWSLSYYYDKCDMTLMEVFKSMPVWLSFESLTAIG